MTVYGVEKSASVLNLTKYVTGAAINENGESSGVVAGTAAFSAIKGGAWVFKNRKDLRGGFQKLSSEMASHKALIENAAKDGKGFWNTAKNLWNGGGEIVSKARLQALAKGTDKVALAAQRALTTGKDFAQSLKAIEGTKGIWKTLVKGIKGNAWFAGISLGIGVLTDVIPAFQLGSDKGFKQLGKTAVKTAAEVGGWAAGSALGAKAGAAIGACIGGPVGAAVGGVVGVLGGFLGSFLCSKAADVVVGPTEVEKAQQEQAEQLAQQAIASGDESVSEIEQAAYNQLLESAIANGGKLSDDDLEAKKALEDLIGEKIDIEADLASLEQSDASGRTAQGTSAQQTLTASVQTQQAQAATPVQSNLPATSGSLYGMPIYNPSAMSAFPYTSYTGTNPFATPTANPFASYTGLYDYGQQAKRQIA